VPVVTVTVRAEVLQPLVASVLTAWQLSPDDAHAAATAITDADLAGIDSHGVCMLPTYERLRDSGELVPAATVEVLRETAVTALLDARGGLGHPAAVRAVTLAGDKARDHGVGVVAVRGSSHFGAAGYYARLAADRGLLALVTTSARTVSVVPTRGAVPALPTNPLAFAAPARRSPPFVLDMSTSTTAINKVKVHGFSDRPLPEGWVLDRSGSPVTDPHEAMRTIRDPGPGGLTPLGGTAELSSHKGYGLALMVQILSATLSGADPVGGRDGRVEIGHFFLALDPGVFRASGAFEADVDDALDALRATPPLDPALPVLVAGDPETACRTARVRDGVPLTAAVHEQLRGVCARAGVPFPVDGG